MALEESEALLVVVAVDNPDPLVGRTGSALDNAAAESFNSTLEHEVLSRQRFATKADARRAVARFIDAYNHQRRHSSCDMLAPVAYEQLLAERAAHSPRQEEPRNNNHQKPSTVSGEAQFPAGKPVNV